MFLLLGNGLAVGVGIIVFFIVFIILIVFDLALFASVTEIIFSYFGDVKELLRVEKGDIRPFSYKSFYQFSFCTIPMLCILAQEHLVRSFINELMEIRSVILIVSRQWKSEFIRITAEYLNLGPTEKGVLKVLVDEIPGMIVGWPSIDELLVILLCERIVFGSSKIILPIYKTLKILWKIYKEVGKHGDGDIVENVENMGIDMVVNSDGVIGVLREKKVIILTSSRDVIHSVSSPELGLKIDSVPGRLNSIFLDLDESEERVFDITCSEFCGVGHPFMNYKMISCNKDIPDI